MCTFDFVQCSGKLRVHAVQLARVFLLRKKETFNADTWNRVWNNILFMVIDKLAVQCCHEPHTHTLSFQDKEGQGETQREPKRNRNRYRKTTRVKRGTQRDRYRGREKRRDKSEKTSLHFFSYMCIFYVWFISIVKTVELLFGSF